MDLQEILRWRQESGGFNHLCGIRVTDIGEGSSKAEVQVTPALLNPMGMAHGGTIYALCDVAAGTAAASGGRVAVTLTGVINYLHPGKPEQVLCAQAQAVKVGKTTAVYDVDVFDGTQRCIAHATFTMYYTDMTVEQLQCRTN